MAASAVTVGTAFAFTGSTAVSAVPAPRAEVVNAAIQAPGTVVPSPQESADIAAVVRRSSLTAAVSPTAYQVTNTVLARSDESWAWVELIPVTDDVDRAAGVLHRGHDGWELLQLGSAEVGCGIVPAAVAADLELECPSDTPTYLA
jgi:hypothetical protein